MHNIWIAIQCLQIQFKYDFGPGIAILLRNKLRYVSTDKEEKIRTEML